MNELTYSYSAKEVPAHLAETSGKLLGNQKQPSQNSKWSGLIFVIGRKYVTVPREIPGRGVFGFVLLVGIAVKLVFINQTGNGICSKKPYELNGPSYVPSATHADRMQPVSEKKQWGAHE